MIFKCYKKTINQNRITKEEVIQFQKDWGESIIKIGKIYLENGDYKSAAIEHVNRFYNYKEGSVLFKPTLASIKQFRTDFRGALSYFISGDEEYPEDKGFALRPWKNIRWENVEIKLIDNIAIAMGNYYLTPLNEETELKVEYSFVFIKNSKGELKILLHDSHFPYSGNK